MPNKPLASYCILLTLPSALAFSLDKITRVNINQTVGVVCHVVKTFQRMTKENDLVITQNFGLCLASVIFHAG